MTPHYLLASPQMTGLAESICEGSQIQQLPIEWKTFPDSFPDMYIHRKESILANADVSFLACFDNPATIFEQLSMMIDLAESSPLSLRFILPYFPTGTMERKDNEGQIATGSSLARLISTVAPAGPGPVKLFMYDIHALQIRHYFGQNIAVRPKSGIKYLKKRLSKDAVIAFPDEGAWKRFRGMFSDSEGNPEYPFIVCQKVREGEERIVKVAEGDPSGRDVVIVDDLIHSGGTTIKCADAIRDAGANSISGYSTHGVMENGAWKKFLTAGFEKMWITDSCPATAKAVEGQGPFEVISLAPSIIRAITQ